MTPKDLLLEATAYLTIARAKAIAAPRDMPGSTAHRVLAVLPSEAWATVDYLADRAGLRLSTVADVLVWMRGRGMAKNHRAVWQRLA